MNKINNNEKYNLNNTGIVSVFNEQPIPKANYVQVKILQQQFVIFTTIKDKNDLKKKENNNYTKVAVLQ